MAYDPEIARKRWPDAVALAYGLIFTALGLVILVVEWPNFSLLSFGVLGVSGAEVRHEWSKRRKQRPDVSAKSDSM